jgi:hypothetical protein
MWSAKGRAIAQAVSRWFPTVAAQVRSRVWSYGICIGQSGTGAGFFRVLRFPLPVFIPPVAPQSFSSIIWGLYNRPEVAAVPSGLSPTPPIIIKIMWSARIVWPVNNWFTSYRYSLKSFNSKDKKPFATRSRPTYFRTLRANSLECWNCSVFWSQCSLMLSFIFNVPSDYAIRKIQDDWAWVGAWNCQKHNFFCSTGLRWS